VKPLAALAVAGGAVLVVRAYTQAASAGRTTTGTQRGPRDTSTARVLPDRAQLAIDRLIADAEDALRGVGRSGGRPALALDAGGRPFSGFLALADQGVQRPFLGGGVQNDVIATRVGAPNRGFVAPAVSVLPTTYDGAATRSFDPGSGAFSTRDGGGDPDGPAPSDSPTGTPSSPTSSPGFSFSPTAVGVLGLLGNVVGLVASAVMGNPFGIVANIIGGAKQAAGMLSDPGPAPAVDAAIGQTAADVAVAGIGNEGLGAPAGPSPSEAAAVAAAADVGVAGIGNEGLGAPADGPSPSGAPAGVADGVGVPGVGADAAGEGAGVGGGDAGGGVGVGDGDGGVGDAGDS
jgi:hypothetical protein